MLMTSHGSLYHVFFGSLFNLVLDLFLYRRNYPADQISTALVGGIASVDWATSVQRTLPSCRDNLGRDHWRYLGDLLLCVFTVQLICANGYSNPALPKGGVHPAIHRMKKKTPQSDQWGFCLQNLAAVYSRKDDPRVLD